MTGSRSAPSQTKALLCPTVIGRDQELRAIDNALAAVQEGRGRALFLLGEAGIGKSRLADEAAAAAEARGMAVLRGRAVQAASPVPYRPLAEALCTTVRSGGPPDTRDLLPFRAALGRLVPEWREERLAGADDSVIVLGEAVLRFLRVTATDRGCLVILEDLHWADPESLMIIEYLVDNLASEPVLCVATLRVEEDSAAFQLARRLDARRACPTFDLPRLDEGEVDGMVAACLNAVTAPQEVVALASRADGLPFLVEELLAATASTGALVCDGDSWTMSESVDLIVPLTFADSVRRRLGPLGAEARVVLQAAAVLGRRFDWSLLPPITGLSNEAVLRALHAAVDAQIVVTEIRDRAFRFRHALTRDAVVAELLPPEHAALAGRALETIEAAHPQLPGAWCELAAELAVATTGTRRGECLGLRWRDVDLAAGRAIIRSTVTAVEHRIVVADRTKTGRGRSIDLDAATVAELRSHRARQAREMLLLGLRPDDDSLVFCHPDGRPYHPERFSREFDRRHARPAFADLPRLRLHDLRHTWATLALAAGVPLKVVSERLGHAKTGITSDLYQHVTPGMGRDAAEKVAGLIFGRPGR